MGSVGLPNFRVYYFVLLSKVCIKVLTIQSIIVTFGWVNGNKLQPTIMVYNQQCILVPLPHPHRGEHLCNPSTLLGCPHEHHELQCVGESPDGKNKSENGPP